MRDLYDILGVPRDADDETIKRAYRRKARELHPDAGGDEEGFKELTTAFEVLKNPQTRANYDRFGDPRGPGGAGADVGGFGDLSDLIDAFFGGFGGRGSSGAAGRVNRQGRDALVDVALTLEEAASGARRDVEITVARGCQTCAGSGAAEGSGPVTCDTCGGNGAVQQVARSIFGQVLTTTTCPACRGAGSRIANPCPDCAGQGRRQSTETVTVDVPAGVDSGTRLRLVGRGEAGLQGAAPGDLYVRVRVAEHAVFTREGDDLHCELRLPMTQAALGAELKVPTLYGEEAVTVPAGVQTGEVITLRRFGMPKLSGGGARGNLQVHVRVVTPTGLSEQEQALLHQLADLRGEDVRAGGRGLFSRIREAFRA